MDWKPSAWLQFARGPQQGVGRTGGTGDKQESRDHEKENITGCVAGGSGAEARQWPENSARIVRTQAGSRWVAWGELGTWWEGLGGLSSGHAEASWCIRGGMPRRAEVRVRPGGGERMKAGKEPEERSRAGWSGVGQGGLAGGGVAGGPEEGAATQAWGGGRRGT